MTVQDVGVSRTPPASPRFEGASPRAATPRQLRTEARAERRYLLASPRMQQIMRDSCTVENDVEIRIQTPREGRRHFVSPPRNPVLECATDTKAEWRPSRQMPYLQAQDEEQPKLDAAWKQIGIFDVNSEKPTQTSPREAPHRLSTGFTAAQQMPTAREVLKQSPRRHDREQQGLGALAYFNNEPPLPLSDGVKRSYDSRNTGETDLGIFQAGYMSPNSPALVDRELWPPWAVDRPNDHLDVESPERVTVQTARKNESSGPLEDGLVVSTLSEGRNVALALKCRGRNNSPASLAMEHHTPCWATNPLPAKQVAKQITDALPAYNSEENVGQLIRHSAEVTMTHKEALPDSRKVVQAPYAMIGDVPNASTSTVQRRHTTGTKTALLEIGDVGVSSLMSSGHSAAVSSKLRVDKDRVALENGSKRKDVGNVSGRKVLKATKEALEEHSQLCDEVHVAVAANAQASIKDSSPKATVRSESALPYRLGGASSSRTHSVQHRRLCIGSTRNNRASGAWSCGLRGQISDKPWISSGEKQVDKVIPEDRKAIGQGSISVPFGSRRPLPKSPRLAVRDELNHDQLEDVTAFMEKGCAERIQTLMNEIGAMSMRNDYLKERIDSFRSEATQLAIADTSFTSKIPKVSSSADRPDLGVPAG